MSISILEITSSSTLVRKELSDLNVDTVREAAAIINERSTWVVTLKVRDELAKLTDVIEDRGKKHPAIELTRTMKSKTPLIPMIEGEYSSGGKLRQSVQRFLGKVGDGPQRLFIIAVADDLFASLNRMAVEHHPEMLPAVSFSGRNGIVLNLLERLKEPPQLCEAFIGSTADAMAVRQLILRAAQVDDTVLIMGETGTGKEVVAQQIHKYSSRTGHKPIAVNCGAFPKELLEAELFGHVKGAFTGAIGASDGLWLAAQNGTLFLDEIGELSLNQQAKLLRSLQEKTIRKVGGTSEIPVNARIICATNRDLYSMVQTGQFREDLYYRLRGFLITNPPLREHRDDIPLLATKFWKKITSNDKALLPEDITSALKTYAWPGNVRELWMVLTTLFSVYHSAPSLDLRHLRAVFEMHEIDLALETKLPDASSSLRRERFATFRHLRQVYETFRAVEHRLTPLLRGVKPKSGQMPQISTGIANHLNELALYDQTPQQFSSHTYENISRLRSRLIHFLAEYERDPALAVASLRDGTRSIIEDAVADILGEIEQVLAGSLG
ncbi:MAG: sigma 54-interacting transcriptional regulator [Desulfuromonadaceae bacterium]|nr:sigma 54-interacting transcriptional regulator [Desulfuromonadaceae bacterium]